MTVEEKLISLAEKLLPRTERGEVQWEESADETQFLTSFPQYSVSIRQVTSEDRWGNTTDGVRISLIDAKGKTLEALALEQGEHAFTALESLYQEARRQALGVNKALDDILGSLG